MNDIEETENLESNPSIKQHRFRWTHLIAICGGASIVVIAIVAVIFRDRVSAINQYGYIGVFVISMLGGATLIVPIPAIVAVFTLGGILNPILVGVSAGLGEAIGELTAYMAGYGERLTLERRFHRVYPTIKSWMKRRGSITLFLFSAILNPFFDLVGAAAGATKYPLWKFLLVCWAGKTVKGMMVAYAGAFGLRALLSAIGIKV